MAIISLTKGRVALVDDADVDFLSQWKWFTVLSDDKAYAARTERSRSRRRDIYMHRALAQAPTGFHVDHKNRDGLDNRRENLRIATYSQNGGNSRARGAASGFKGVGAHVIEGVWRARIMVDRRNRHLGLFRSPEEAARAYDAAAIRFFGEFARVNFPTSEQMGA